MDKGLQVIVYHQKCCCIRSRLKFVPVRDEQLQSFPLFFSDILSDVRSKKSSVRHVDFLFFIISEERKSNLLRRQF